MDTFIWCDMYTVSEQAKLQCEGRVLTVEMSEGENIDGFVQGINGWMDKRAD